MRRATLGHLVGGALPTRALVALVAAALVGCADPVPEGLEADQGPEAPGVPAGPLHRPGQHCLACHRSGGSATPLSVAGTVYAREGEPEGAAGVAVVLRDARGQEHTVTSNEVGNFWLAERARPAFPLVVELRVGDRAIAMRTEIPREGSCNACHRGAGDARRMPGVFVEAAR